MSRLNANNRNHGDDLDTMIVYTLIVKDTVVFI